MSYFKKTEGHVEPVFHDRSLFTKSYFTHVSMFLPSELLVFKDGPRIKDLFTSQKLGVDGRIIVVNDKSIEVPMYFFTLESAKTRMYGNMWPTIVPVTGEFNTVPDGEALIPVPRLELFLEDNRGISYATGELRNNYWILTISNTTVQETRPHPEDIHLPRTITPTHKGLLARLD